MRVEYTKWDGRAHWRFDVDDLGEDEHGLWLAAPPGGLLQRGDEPPIEGPGWACLVPHTGCWIAHFYLAGDVDVYINVTDQPKRLQDSVTAIDLDLDVVAWRDGRVEVEDEDEFYVHAATFRYPSHIVAVAQATARDLVAAVNSGIEPFGSAAQRWRRRVAR